MANEQGLGHDSPSWFVAPGDGDVLAWVAFGFVCLAIYGIVTLYAAFDRWAEHQAKGTPLAKTIPTMLTIALLYEIFPLDHFHVLLPLSAILLALMADWSRFHLRNEPLAEPAPVDVLPEASEGPSVDAAPKSSAGSEEAQNV